MSRSSYYGTKVLHPRSVKQVIADIEEAMRNEAEGTPGYEQYERALNYWRNRPKRKEIKEDTDGKAKS